MMKQNRCCRATQGTVVCSLSSVPRTLFAIMQAPIRPSAEPRWGLAALGAVHVQLRSGFGHIRAFLAQQAQSLLSKLLQMHRQTQPQHNSPAGSTHVPCWRAAHRAHVCLSPGHWPAEHEVRVSAHFIYLLSQAQGAHCDSVMSKPTQPQLVSPPQDKDGMF